ncbi:protein kinase [Trypanosoma brucei equiperdum]|uniref:Protein kinase n=1 Tax=Trypanosoma brucei equiperdum TaxID=630700 RepID=A0A3L6L426_9TRYP|nr:protein kinase [Trypanosoma brucei equiperdum]
MCALRDIASTSPLGDAIRDRVKGGIIVTTGEGAGSSPASTINSSPLGMGRGSDDSAHSPRSGNPLGWEGLEGQSLPFFGMRSRDGTDTCIHSHSYDQPHVCPISMERNLRPSSSVSWLCDETLSEGLAGSPKSSFSPLVASPRFVNLRDSVVAASPLDYSEEHSPRFASGPSERGGSFCSQFSDNIALGKQLQGALANPTLWCSKEESPRSTAPSPHSPRVGCSGNCLESPDLKVASASQPGPAAPSHDPWKKVLRCLTITTTLQMLLFVVVFATHYFVTTWVLVQIQAKCTNSSLAPARCHAFIGDRRPHRLGFITTENFTVVGTLSGFVATALGVMILRYLLWHTLRSFSMGTVSLICRVAPLLQQEKDAIVYQLQEATSFSRKEASDAGNKERSETSQPNDKKTGYAPNRLCDHKGGSTNFVLDSSCNIPKVNTRYENFHELAGPDFAGGRVPLRAVRSHEIIPVSSSPLLKNLDRSNKFSTPTAVRHNYWSVREARASDSTSLSTQQSDACIDAFALPRPRELKVCCDVEGHPLKTNLHKHADPDKFDSATTNFSQEVTGRKEDAQESSSCKTKSDFSTSNSDQLLLETFGSKNAMLSNSSFLAQQVTFLVCRLFLPALDLEMEGVVTTKRLRAVQAMSQQFTEVVLRVAREEFGVPFDIRLDSVVVTFHTPSGPNSVNLVRPRDCAFRLVSELQKLESQWARTSSLPFVWGIAMHLSQLLVGVIRTPSGRTSSLYGEEVRLAYRVTELCRILDCPLLMLQPCYDVFRVCVTAVPVDVIHRRTCGGDVRIYLYDPKAPKERECVGSSREQYAPLMAAFGLMCEKRFSQASEQLEKVLELDHNAPRLHRLCKYLAQEHEGEKMNSSLSDITRYVREGPQWCAVDREAKKFIRKKIEKAGMSIDMNATSLSVSQYPFNDVVEPGCAQEISEEYRLLHRVANSCAMMDLSRFGQCECHVSPQYYAAPGSFQPNEIQSEYALVTLRQNTLMNSSITRDVCIVTHQRSSSACGVMPECNYKSDRTIAVVAPPHGENTIQNGDCYNKAERLEFDIYGPVGAGSFGRVYRGLHPDGNIVAIKEYPVPSMDENNPEIQSTLSEIRMLSASHHKNIVRYVDRCFQNGCLYIITEFVSGGSLAALVETFHGLPCDIIRRYTGDILRGLQYLHDRQIVHRDISPNNVLVSIDGVCKLSDFGGAVECAMQPPTSEDNVTLTSDEKSPTRKRTMVLTTESDYCSTGSTTLKTCFGTPVCMSPEACMGVVDPRNDIWGLGITLCFCVACSYPWSQEDTADVRSFISKLRRGCISPEPPFDLMDVHFADFVRQCLKRDAKDRPSASELLFHDFMVN